MQAPFRQGGSLRIVYCVVALLLVAAVVLVDLPFAPFRALSRPVPSPGAVLLVTAHPDDETIFFSPTLQALRRAGREVHILCLTTGDAYGQGRQRVNELRAAAEAMQVDRQHLVVVNDSDMLDGKSERWDLGKVVTRIAEEVARRDIGVVVTFDEAGVYGHVNHIDCASAVRQYVALCAGSGNQKCAAAWMLVTEPSLRKRLGPLPALLESAGCHDQHCAVYLNPSIPTTMRAMWQHKTQRRWWTHVLTTSYTFVNSLHHIEPPHDIVLDGGAAPRLWHQARRARSLHARRALAGHMDVPRT